MPFREIPFTRASAVAASCHGRVRPAAVAAHAIAFDERPAASYITPSEVRLRRRAKRIDDDL